jgi:hypothetical protein
MRFLSKGMALPCPYFTSTRICPNRLGDCYSSSRYYAVHLDGRMKERLYTTQNFMYLIAAKTAVYIRKSLVCLHSTRYSR